MAFCHGGGRTWNILPKRAQSGSPGRDSGNPRSPGNPFPHGECPGGSDGFAESLLKKFRESFGGLPGVGSVGEEVDPRAWTGSQQKDLHGALGVHGLILDAELEGGLEPVRGLDDARGAFEVDTLTVQDDEIGLEFHESLRCEWGHAPVRVASDPGRNRRLVEIVAVRNARIKARLR